MSGGSLEYVCFDIENKLVGKMQDPELDMLVKDLADLARSLEWYLSGDNNKEQYRDDVKTFKEKWLSPGSQKQRYVDIIDDSITELKHKLLQMVGEIS